MLLYLNYLCLLYLYLQYVSNFHACYLPLFLSNLPDYLPALKWK